MEVFKKSLQGILTRDDAGARKRGVYYVPEYQRRFSWSDETIKKFLDDLSEVALVTEEHRDLHFFGAMVFHDYEGGKEAFHVVDGQQRLVAVTMTLAQTANLYEKYGKKAEALNVRKILRTLALDDEEDEKARPVITLNDRDQALFREIIYEGNPNPTFNPKGGRRPRILGAWEKISRELDEWSREPDNRDPLEIVRSIRKAILNKFIVIEVVLDQDEDPHIIFEALNFRSEHLRAHDLLKNFIYAKAEPYPNEARVITKCWEESSELVGQAIQPKDPAIEMDNFLRRLWLSKYEFVRSNKLYGSIKSNWKERINRRHATAIQEIADELRDEARLYTAVMNPRNEWTNELYSNKVKDLVRTLGISQMVSILMAALSEYKKQNILPGELRSLIDSLESLAVRYVVLGGQRPGPLEEKYHRWAVDLRKKELSASQLRGRIEEFTATHTTDSMISEHFVTMSPADSTAKFILRRLEDRLKHEVTSGKRSTTAKLDIEIEHILPKSKKKWGEKSLWKTMDAEELKLLTSNIGNLTLLTREENEEAKNKTFDKKLPVYSSSELLITKVVYKDESDWTPQRIRERARWLSEIACRAWPMPLGRGIRNNHRENDL